MERIIMQLRQCAADISDCDGTWGLEAQIRAYNLLDRLLAMSDGGFDHAESDEFRAEARKYIDACRANVSVIEGAYDEAALRSELASRLVPFDEALNEARFEAAAAASLHEFAKEVYETWQTAGIFARRRALRELRERAGFRLESHRIGNYVAKTFDLMNEAQARFAKAQQARFAADSGYMIRPCLCGRICEVLKSWPDEV